MINFIMLRIIITCIILHVLHACMHSYFVVNASSYRPFYTQDIGIWWLVGGKIYALQQLYALLHSARGLATSRTWRMRIIIPRGQRSRGIYKRGTGNEKMGNRK